MRVFGSATFSTFHFDTTYGDGCLNGLRVEHQRKKKPFFYMKMFFVSVREKKQGTELNNTV